MSKEHFYQLSLKWTGNKGEGTTSYTSYERSHIISGENKPKIPASSDPAFRGDSRAYNPEELLIASISGCHMLWFLHLCAKNGIVVVDYTDNPTGVLTEEGATGGRMTSVTLNPIVSITEASSLQKLNDLHKQANQLCFIANSVNFTVNHNPIGKVVGKIFQLISGA